MWNASQLSNQGMCTTDGLHFISLLPAALKSVATVSFTQRSSGSALHNHAAAFYSHPVFRKWLAWVQLHLLMHVARDVGEIKNVICCGKKITAIKLGRIYMGLLYYQKKELH